MDFEQNGLLGKALWQYRQRVKGSAGRGQVRMADSEMNDAIVGLLFSSGILTLVAWACVYTTRPFFKSKLAKIFSQTIVSVILIISFALSKELNRTNGASNEEVLVVFTIFLSIKSVAMYLIGCYAKSVGKSPYWSFVVLSNSLLALTFIATSLWQNKKVSDTRLVDE
jgi:hypothetical protein